ncbi:MAG: FtsX-like permease family protein [Bacteroides sp.]|jgi:putative ABC transport system permease protein|nr:FtsX-like permease family protein [Bacteroides sp.]
MLKNFLISAWRNMVRSKLYTLINIFCLSVGITGATLIILYLNHELSYDTFHEKFERIYRLDGKYQVGGSFNHLAITPFPLGPALKLEFSQVEEYCRIFGQEDVLVKVEDREFLEDDFALVDTTFFEVFTHRFIHGQAEGALTEPNTLVLTESLSKKYFGQENPVGKQLLINQRNFQVTGVIEDFPDNATVKLNALLTINQSEHQRFYSLDSDLWWSINGNFTYILLHPGNSIESILGNMEAFNKKYVEPAGSQFGASAEFVAVPLRETHLTQVTYAPDPVSKTTLLIFSIVALFLIVIAAVNYTNLATARASQRAREIAMRKVTGATRQQMIVQFLSESLLVALISLILSLLLVEILLSGFNTLADKSFTLGNVFQGKIILQILLITFLTGILSGIYPAFFLSSMEPVTILKSINFKKGGSGLFRKILVIFQFAISIILVAGTLTVRKQLDYLQEKPLGFNPNNKLVITLQSAEQRQGVETLEALIRQNPNITGTTKLAFAPAQGHNVNAVKVQSGTEMTETVIGTNFIDHEFLDLMKVQLKQGRGFEKELRADAQNSVIINEAAVKTFGWHEEPLGKAIEWQFGASDSLSSRFTVVGVFEDFHSVTLDRPIEPLMLLLPPEPVYYRCLIVEHLTGKEEETMDFLETTLREFDSSRLPNIFPLTQGFSQQFSAEKRQGIIFGIFALVCIFISFLGLFGLSSYLTEQRKKEVGIRKVLGSSGKSILLLFYREFLVLVLISSILSAPLIWFLMDKWLQGFPYRTTMNLWPILYATILALIVAILTVSYHTLRAARQNPVDAIRAE